MKKIFFYLSISTFVLAILPIPLAFFGDLTYHWLLLVTIPIGGILGGIFLIIWAVLNDREKKRNEKKI